MLEQLSLFPEAASTVAGRIDAIYFFLIGVTIFFSVGISVAIAWCIIRYRQREGHVAQQIEGSLPLEIAWSIVPLLICLFLFAWGSKVFYDVLTPPRDAMTFYVTGKQWMWKLQHPTGQREINKLHIPRGEKIALQMISEDVIHDFWIPAFRVKADVIPGSYSTIWFEATKVGTYDIFCAEYCGTKHSEMIGEVVVMDPADYQAWLSAEPAGVTPEEAGLVFFENFRCDTCHAASSGQRGPALESRFGEPVALADGQTVRFDENYIRESILEPRKKVSVGYQPLMPTYQGQISEDQLLKVIAYLKSLTPPGATSTEPPGTQPTPVGDGEGGDR